MGMFCVLFGAAPVSGHFVLDGKRREFVDRQTPVCPSAAHVAVVWFAPASARHRIATAFV